MLDIAGFSIDLWGPHLGKLDERTGQLTLNPPRVGDGWSVYCWLKGLPEKWEAFMHVKDQFDNTESDRCQGGLDPKCHLEVKSFARRAQTLRVAIAFADENGRNVGLRGQQTFSIT